MQLIFTFFQFWKLQIFDFFKNKHSFYIFLFFKTFYIIFMFFLPKCYERLKQESSLLKNSGWCEKNLKKNWFISPDLQKKKRKKLFLNSFENLQFFSSLSLTSFHQPHL